MYEARLPEWLKVVARDHCSVVDSQGLHILHPSHNVRHRLPAEQCHEAFVSRGDVQQRTKEDRLKIFVPENMVMLTAEQNLKLPKKVKRAARQYLVAYYGRERIQAFLDSVEWREPLEQMIYEAE